MIRFVFHEDISAHGVEKRRPCENTVIVIPGGRQRPERPHAGGEVAELTIVQKGELQGRGYLPGMGAERAESLSECLGF